MENRLDYKATLRDYLYIIFKRKGIIITSFIIVMSVVIAGSILMSPVYVAQTKIVAEPEQASPLFSEISYSREATYFKRKEFILTQIEIVKSWSLVEKALKELKFEEKPEFIALVKDASDSTQTPQETHNLMVSLVQSMIDAEMVIDSNIIIVTAEYSNPKIAADIANTISKIYVEDKGIIKQKDAVDSYNFLGKEVKQLETKLASADEALASFKKEKNIVSLPDVAKETLERLSKFDIAYIDAQRELQELEVKKDRIKQQLSSENKQIVTSINSINNPLFNDLKKRLFELELQYSDANSRYSADSKEIEDFKSKIKETKETINNTLEKIVGTEVTGINPIYQSLFNDLIKTEIDQATLQIRVKALKQRVDEYSKNINALPDDELELARLTREKNNCETIYNLYLKRFEESRIATNMNNTGDFVRIIENALPPLKPSRPKKVLNGLIGIVIGTVLGIGMAFILEYFDHTFHTSIDIEKYIGISVLGTIPKYKKAKRGYFPKEKKKKIL